ncbi:Alkanal monooxygenase alpha chain [Corynebacterium occultum]|uniref:Alkanal monooxygenase alpha chain n=1 Tax=Corynebacterium occultum TaxID=2675219 RepID=A0A6B8VXG8_9CORY|nr:LLM class flavin-dependent oxidoreductase [Corynebacterium occultum]QGU07769.1 Alkanal monooxygenase alpha chain [Corynebacterium occultum]
MSTTPIQFGLDTFGDVTWDAEGTPLPHDQVVRNVVEEGVLADRVGVDVFGVGEHHRDDYAVSAPDIVLTAIAARTKKIILTTSVTVLSSDDPVRVFERFSTIDAISSGRAEMILGRGSFIESFPLFGFDLDKYEVLYEEKLDLMRKILDADQAGTGVTWEGTTRSSLENQKLYPPTADGLRPWVAVGGSPESVVRAARQKMPLMLAVIGGQVRRFRPFVDLYKRANNELGNPQLPVGIHSPGLIADTDAEAQERLYYQWMAMQRRIGAERGWPEPTKGRFLQEINSGSLYVGSPDTVAAKMVDAIEALELDRFTLKYSNGPVQHEHAMDTIRLYGEEVIPRVRRILGQR